MTKTTGKFLLLMRHVIPSARIRLLLGSWIIASGLISCGSGTKNSTTGSDSGSNTDIDTSQVMCYDIVVDSTDAEEADQMNEPGVVSGKREQTGIKSCDSGAVKTCYACTKN